MREKSMEPTASLERVYAREFSPELEALIDEETRAFEEARPKPEDFAGKEYVLYKMQGGRRTQTAQREFKQKQVSRDTTKLQELHQRRAETVRDTDPEIVAKFEKGKRLSSFMEAMAIKHGSMMFPGNAEVLPVSEFTDEKQGVDAVVVVRDDEGSVVQLLGLDFTYADSEEELRRKLATSMRGVVRGTLSNARYIRIDDRNYEAGMIPKVIVPFSDDSVVEAGEALAKHRGGEARVQLKPSAQTRDFLELARMQIDMQLKAAEEVSREHFRPYPPFQYSRDDIGGPMQKADMIASLKAARKYLADDPVRLSRVAQHDDTALKTMRHILETDTGGIYADAVQLVAAPAAQAEDVGAFAEEQADVGASPDVLESITDERWVDDLVRKYMAPRADRDILQAALAADPAHFTTEADFDRLGVPPLFRPALLARIQEKAVAAGIVPQSEPVEPASEDPAPIEPAPEPDPEEANALKGRIADVERRIRELKERRAARLESAKEPGQSEEEDDEKEKDVTEKKEKNENEDKKKEEGRHAHEEHKTEWGWLTYAGVIGGWEVVKFLWKFVLHPMVHTAGYALSGDPKHPWKSFWNGFFGDVKKAFKMKGGGGHGGGGGGHGGDHGGGHH